MKIAYITGIKKPKTKKEKILMILKKMFNIITIERKENNIIYYLPIEKKYKLSKNKIKKLVEKLNNSFETEGIINAVISKYFNNIKYFKNRLYSKNINILDGRYLFKCLIYDLIKYVFNIKNEQMELRRNFHLS